MLVVSVDELSDMIVVLSNVELDSHSPALRVQDLHLAERLVTSAIESARSDHEIVTLAQVRSAIEDLGVHPVVVSHSLVQIFPLRFIIVYKSAR